MTYSIEDITAKINALPEPMQHEVFNFIEFMHIKAARQASSFKPEPASSSEQASAIDWNRPEEDDSWVSY